MDRVAQLIEMLELAPHPEGGHYREIWRAELGVAPADGRSARAALTSIYYLLPAGAMSRAGPSLMMSTSFTESGSATALGRRTAWLLLLLNTRDRSMGRC